MLYAIDYQNIVDSLYSVGTPYNGSTLYDELLSNGADLCNFKVDDLISFEDDAIRDCVDPDVYEDLKLNWNIYQQNSSSFHTKLYAIGCSMSIDLIDDIIDNISNNGFLKILIKCFSFFSIDQYTNLNRDEYNDILDISSRYSSGELVDNFTGISSFSSFAQFTANIFNYLIDNEVLDELCSENYISAIGSTLASMLQSMVFDYELNQYVMQNDFFVDLASQQAEGYLNVIQYEKIFTVCNCKKNLLANNSWGIAIGHNLETKDEDVINCILSNIYLGENDIGINIKYNSEETYYEFIGYNEDIAIKSGVLTLRDYLGESNIYILSNKFFSKDYTIARVPTSTTYEQKQILELKFNTNILMSDKALTFLKGNVIYTTNGILRDMWNNLYTISNDSIYKSNTLIKYGNNSLNTSVILNNVNQICDGAFYGQNIQSITINGNSNVYIGNYAFYDCYRLNNIEANHDISSVGNFAFKNTSIYKNNDNYIIRNALVHASGDDGMIIESFSPITYVAPGTFKNDSNYFYLILEKDNIMFADNAFVNTNINNIFLYTSLINLGENKFFYSNKARHPIFYSCYTFDDDYINYTLYDSFNIIFSYREGNRRKTYNLLDVRENIIGDYDYSDIYLFQKNILGYVIDWEKQNNKVFDVVQDFNIYKEADKVVKLYTECSDESYHEFDNIIDMDEDAHLICCSKCDYRVSVEHNFEYTESINNHIKECSCGRTIVEQHIYGDDIEYFDHITHTISCVYCGHMTNESHNFENKYVEYNNQLYNANVCVDCGYIIPLYSVTAIDNGDNHLLSDGAYQEHEYIDVQYQDIVLKVCKYCGHHIHNGLIMQNTNDRLNHSVYCYYCQTVVNMPHNFDNYICQYNDLYDGYHTKECVDCGYIVEEEHYYIYDDTYNDLHHLICRNCGAATIYHHDEVLSCNPTLRYHTEYCDICECYYYVLHNFEYYDIIESDVDGHYMLCNDCGYYKKVNHEFTRYYNEYGHYDKCTICGYETEISAHTPQFNCSSLDPHNHYLYCTECDYRLSTTLTYQIYYEYEHWCTCSICNTRIHEPHEGNCECIDNILHMYMCYLCDIEYEMPHFVNNHLIIYENFEPGYDLWVCTYCGYMEIVFNGGNG